MMYLVFLAYLYKLQGGRFRSFVRSAMGYDVEADRTPTGPTTSGNGDAAAATKKTATRAGVAGYMSDGAASDGSDPGVFGASTTAAASFAITPGDKSRALLGLDLSKSAGGGTFSGSYQRVPSWNGEGGVEEGAAPRSLSINSDGGADMTRELPGGDSDSPTIKHAMKSNRRSLEAPEEGATGVAAKRAYSWFLSFEDRQILKRRTILARISSIVLLTSFASDLDLITDWTFLHYGLSGQGFVIRKLALFFAIMGTIMWALSTTEFSLMSKLKTMWKGNPLSRLQHVGLGWQLLANVFLEDVPQFVITIITRPTSVSGVLNLTASGLSLCAKIVKGISSQRAPSLSTQFMMIDQDPAVTRNLFKLRDEAKKKAKAAEQLVYLAWENRCSEGEQKAAAVFQVLQMDPTFVNGDLDYMRPDLFAGSRLYITACSLKGSIPTELGNLTVLKTLVLCRNQLSGPIPVELGNLFNLMELNLSENVLSGPIPPELAQLSSLITLDLSTNALTGSIPGELSDLKLLTTLMLGCNRLTGEIPPELSALPALQELDLSQNQLTGPIPEEFGETLDNLRSFSVSQNMLTGPVPMSLGKLTQLKSLVVASNMLTDAQEAEEQLKLELHPECLTDFLPQQKPEEDEEEEGAEDGTPTQELLV